MSLADEMRLLREAVRKVPVVRFALGLVGIAAALSIIRALLGADVTFSAIFPLLLGMMALMAILLILSTVAGRSERRNPVRIIALVLLWALCLCTIFLMGVFSSAVAFGKPDFFAKRYLPAGAKQTSISDILEPEPEPTDDPPPPRPQTWLNIVPLEAFEQVADDQRCSSIASLSSLQIGTVLTSSTTVALFDEKPSIGATPDRIAASRTCFRILDASEAPWLRVLPTTCQTPCEEEADDPETEEYADGATNQQIFGAEMLRAPEGYIYYATENGFPTEFSNLILREDSSFPRIEALGRGAILVATRAKNLRARPTTKSKPTYYSEGSCFEVLRSEPVFYKDQSAVWSAGWLPVEHQDC